MRDNLDAIVENLRAIRGLLGDQGFTQELDVSQVEQPLRALHGGYTIVETKGLADANDDGTVTVDPGETKTLLRHETSTGAWLLAVGANDGDGVSHWIEVDNTMTVGGQTNSPLGTVNTPFSFVDTLDGAIPATRTIEYKVSLSSSASAPLELAARGHVLARRQQG